MAAASGTEPLATLNNRRLAAQAILLGYDDPDLSTVLTTARNAGYKDGQSVESTQTGGIIASINR